MQNTDITSSSLNNTINVDAQQIADFRQNGHVLIKNILSEQEVAVYRKAINDTVKKLNTETRKIEDRDTYGKAFLQIYNLWLHNPLVRDFVLSKRFGQIAADLMGVKKVRLYHDQALYKEPGGGPTPWHQDQYYWPLDTANTVTMWMPLVDINVEMGMLTFASKSHKDGVIKDISISDESDAILSQHVTDKQYPITRATEMKAGDATWHYGYTIHQAPGNQSDTMREVMTIIFMDAETKVAVPKHKAQELDHEVWLRKIEPGKLAASDLNPVIE